MHCGVCFGDRSGVGCDGCGSGRGGDSSRVSSGRCDGVGGDGGDDVGGGHGGYDNGRVGSGGDGVVEVLIVAAVIVAALELIVVVVVILVVVKVFDVVIGCSVDGGSNFSIGLFFAGLFSVGLFFRLTILGLSHILLLF